MSRETASSTHSGVRTPEIKKETSFRVGADREIHPSSCPFFFFFHYHTQIVEILQLFFGRGQRVTQA